MIEPKFQEIEVISYSPLLYKVKLNNEYGILDENGDAKVNIAYDKIGFLEESNTVKSVTIMKKLKDNHDCIVVCKNNKYGIVDLENGETVLECRVDKIYAKEYDTQKDKYYIEDEGKEMELMKYINKINTMVIVRDE